MQSNKCLVLCAVLCCALSHAMEIPTVEFAAMNALVNDNLQSIDTSYSGNHTATARSALKAFSTSVLSDQESDQQITSHRENTLRMHSLQLDVTSHHINENVMNVTNLLFRVREASKPSDALKTARRTRDMQRIHVHELHRQCRALTSDLDRTISDLNKRSSELAFIRNTIDDGAFPETIGNLVNQYGHRSQIDKVVERTLLNLIELQEKADMITKDSVSFLQVTDPSWGESISSILETMKADISSSLASSYTSASMLATSIEDIFYNKFMRKESSNPTADAGSAQSSASQNGNSKNLDPVSNIQMDTPLLDVLDLNDDKSVMLTIDHMSLTELQDLCVAAVFRAANPKSSSSKDPSILTHFFGHPVTPDQITTAVLQTLANNFITNGCRDVHVTESSPNSLNVRIRLNDSNDMRLLISSLSSGSLIENIRTRLLLGSDVTIRLPQQQMEPTQDLLSFDEGSDSIPTDCGPEGCKDVGSILTRVLKSAQHTRKDLEAKKEITLQPCAQQLTDAQQKLTQLDSEVHRLEQRQVDPTVTINILNQAIDVLRAAKDRAEKSAMRRDERVQTLRSNFDERQKLRDASLDMVQSIGPVVSMSLGDVIRQREEDAKKRQQEAEQESLRIFLQNQLKQRQQICDNTLEDLNINIQKFRNSLSLLDRMLEIINGANSTSDQVTRNTLNVMSYALDERIGASAMLQTEGSSTASIQEALQKIRGSTQKLLDESIQARTDQMAQCVAAIEHLQKQIQSELVV